MRVRKIWIKRNAASDKYLLASWYLKKFPTALVYCPQDFGYVIFQQ